MFTALATAIDELEILVDEQELLATLTLQDRLNAKVAMAVGKLDRAELWDVDGSVSMAAWLRVHAGMTQRDAMRLVSTGRRLHDCPETAQAWLTGAITGGQVAVILGNVTNDTLPLFQEREHLVLNALVGRDIQDTTTYMHAWAARARAELDRQRPDPTPEPEAEPSAVHLSPLLDGRGRLDGDLDVELHDLLRTALRLAETRDLDGEPARLTSERRADALGDVLRFFLDHQQQRSGGRHRPHVNVVIDFDDLEQGGPGRTMAGWPIDGASMRRILCDAGVHRVITDGLGSILDYGRTTRTIPPAVYTSLLLRDLGCRFPGCDRPGEWCEGHHIQHWEDGGPTCLSNLVLFCSKHHHLVHLRGWHVKRLDTGRLEVTRPDGTLRTSDPPVRC
jgi:hypothetical protein